ncbi:MAG: YicC family protein [Akkermansiaceae bacterium]|nr:YicC family protein [Akkermansiaceae bacterium]
MRSMTGFGRGSAATAAWVARLEIGTVNRKQAEVVVMLPKDLAELDAGIRKLAQAVVSRGRVQVNVALEPAAGGTANVRMDAVLARGLEEAFTQLSTAIGRPVQPQATDFLRQPGVLTIGAREIDPAEAWAAIEPALHDALAQLTAMREREGADLAADLITRLSTLDDLTGRIAAAAPERPLRQRELLLKRLREAGLELDLADERVTRELALFADRCDVSEELTRLASHFGKFREYMAAAEPPGRALDFLCQEIFREFNTIGAKANDAGIAQAVVEAKTELEKIREQVQNVE